MKALTTLEKAFELHPAHVTAEAINILLELYILRLCALLAWLLSTEEGYQILLPIS